LLWIFLEMGSHKLFAGAGLKPQSSQFQPPKLARITGVSHQAQLNFTYFMHTQYGHLHCAQAAAHHTQSFPLLFFFLCSFILESFHTNTKRSFFPFYSRILSECTVLNQYSTEGNLHHF
jgi:hypothetical protein